MPVEVKKVMDIESIPVIVMPDDEDMELAVELAMDIADMVLVGDPDIDILSISMRQLL